MLKWIALILLFTFLASCKKGANDPLFSIISRKKRLQGSWTLYIGSGDRMLQYQNQSQTVNSTEDFDYYNFTNHVTYSDGLQELNYNQDMYVYFKFYAKDSVEHVWTTQLFNQITGAPYTQEITKRGTWEWRAGDGKPKSHIQVKYHYIQTQEDCIGCDTTETEYSGDNKPSQEYKIDRLSKREFNILFTEDLSDSASNYVNISNWQMNFIKD